MKSLADIIAYNTAHADEALKFGQGQLTASQATDLTDPAQQRDLRDRARHPAHRRAHRDRQRADDQHRRGDPHAVGHADRHRRPRRLPADRRPGRLRRDQAAGRSASPSTAPPTARPSCSRSPTPTSRRRSCAGRRARSTRRRGAATPAPRARARPAVRSATGVTLPFSLETATVSDLQSRMAAGTLSAVDADQGLPAADRAHQHRGPVASTPCG